MFILAVAVMGEAIRSDTLIPSRHLGSGFILEDGIWGDSKQTQDNLVTHRKLGESCGAC